jgi:FdhD protein
MDETSIWIAVNGRRVALLSCTPDRIEALVAGHLLAEGWIAGVSDIQELAAVNGPGGACGVNVTLEDATAQRALELRRHRLEHGCGLRHILDCITALATPRGAAPPPLTESFRALFAAADDAAPEGGAHAAALAGTDGLHHLSVDVARHCAVDRVLGLAALAGDDLSAAGLLTTSRISGAMAIKAVNAGLPWLASRSIATPLARDIAEAAGVRLLERAARRDGSGSARGAGAATHRGRGDRS